MRSTRSGVGGMTGRPSLHPFSHKKSKTASGSSSHWTIAPGACSIALSELMIAFLSCLLFPDHLDELRQRDRCALHYLIHIESAERMLNLQQRQIGHAENLGLRRAEFHERIRTHDRGNQ